MQSRRICQSPSHKTDRQTTEGLGENRPRGRSLYPERDSKQPKTKNQTSRVHFHGMLIQNRCRIFNHFVSFFLSEFFIMFKWTLRVTRTLRTTNDVHRKSTLQFNTVFYNNPNIIFVFVSFQVH